LLLFLGNRVFFQSLANAAEAQLSLASLFVRGLQIINILIGFVFFVFVNVNCRRCCLPFGVVLLTHELFDYKIPATLARRALVARQACCGMVNIHRHWATTTSLPFPGLVRCLAPHNCFFCVPRLIFVVALALALCSSVVLF
jgi:hypothetical protein